ncbi:MAG: acetylxylan esterase [bacterium]|nr:acetylxylan esterase [bacterium]
MKNTLFYGLLSVILFLLIGSIGNLYADPASQAPVIKVRTERPDSLYTAGETIRFTIQFIQNDRIIAGKVLKYLISGDGGLNEEGELQTTEQPYVIKTEMYRPGIVTCTVTGRDEAAGKPVTGAWGAGIDVDKITPGMPMPDDLDSFWQKAKAELAAVPIQVMDKQEIPFPEYVSAEVRKQYEDKGVKLYDIKIACAGGMPVSGYLSLPGTMKKGQCPGLVRYTAAPGHIARPEYALDFAAAGGIGLSINAHGHENGRDQKYIEEFCKTMGPWFGPDPQKIYVRGMALRALRAVQYIKSLPEWNGHDLTVTGGSMGGGQALLAAALDKDISLCEATVPAFCDWAGGLKQQRSGWPGALARPEDIKAAAYYDPVNLCKYIKAPTIMITGFIDPLCASSGHYAVYNRLTCPKLIVHNPGGGHSGELYNPTEDIAKIKRFRAEQKAALMEKRSVGSR